jgi:hypothetical protein
VLGGTPFAVAVTVDADDRAHRHRDEHRASPWPGHLGVRLPRRGGGADEPNQSENSSATPMTNTPGFIVIQRGSQQLRAGRAGSGKGAGRMIAAAINTARAAGARGPTLVRGDSAYGTRAVVGACLRHYSQFSLVMTRNTAVQRAIAAIDEDAWTPVAYPGAVHDPDTGTWISDAEVAETTYTIAESGTGAITARLIVRRVKDANQPRDTLFPIWRYHPFFTNTTETATDSDITHRRHAIIETTFADLIDGPLAHIPSGRFGANSAWPICAAIAHNLLRAAATLAGTCHRTARGATLRRHLVNIPARLARPQRRPVLHLPSHWPWEPAWITLWRNTISRHSTA